MAEDAGSPHVFLKKKTVGNDSFKRGIALTVRTSRVASMDTVIMLLNDECAASPLQCTRPRTPHLGGVYRICQLWRQPATADKTLT